jgi:SSS family solute:Na+ symporter
MLGLLALTGFMALYAGVADMPEFAAGFTADGNNFAVPALILHSFPDWFAGVAFAAIGIGGLVPAAIMSIAAANLYTRNIHMRFVNPKMTEKEAKNAKIVSLVVKVGALIFILGLQPEYAITLQLLGGIWMSQTFPSVILGLYTRWLNPYALVSGWAAGIVVGTWMVSTTNFNSSIYALDGGVLTVPGYAALYAMIVNFALTYGLTPLFNRISWTKGTDETDPSDYHYGRSKVDDPNPASVTALE